MAEVHQSQELVFNYRNWRGTESTRRVLPKRIWFGESEWHSGPQWFMQALDLEKNEIRDFALVDMVFTHPPAR
ncbi:hypothetical protein SAMN05421853_102128 [Roseivivax halotolerans]|uniref:WYL domain-containing protein n=1 Tax=Roseivivax halotolerans TaxID=93684 RepID=A0A1I5W510_9RHOB|nr:hypothetical protein SAMN05421853_102128 [Roseivivax halotolerans]